MRVLLSLLGKVVDQKSGMEKVLCNMANAMVKRGHDVAIVTYELKAGKPFFPLDDRVKYHNAGFGKKENRLWVNLTSMFFKRNHREYRRMMSSSRKAAVSVKKFLESFAPQVIISYEEKSLIVYKEILNINTPVIAMCHFDAETILSNPYFHKTYLKADMIQVLMNSDITKMKNVLDKNEIVRIGNVVEQNSESSSLRNKTIINVGRVEPNQKQQHIIVEAMARLKDKYPDWKVEIWGDTTFDSKYVSHIKALITKYGLENQVLLCGTTGDIKGKLLQASIFAFPSAYEGFGLALTEAMSVGLPAISFDSTPAVNEILSDRKNGLLVENTVEAFTAGLDELMSSFDLRCKLGKQAKKDVEIYKPDNIWNEWENLLKGFGI